MAATLKEIAEKAGVAISTVSMVVNNKPHRIPEKTREKIMQIAKELQYKPNQFAVGLVTKRTMRIGVLVDDLSNTFFSEIAKGSQEGAEKYGYSTLISNVFTTKRRSVEACVGRLLESGVDGLIMAIAADEISGITQEAIEELYQKKVPMVFIGRPNTGKGPNVEVDHEKGAYLAAKHLIECGHTSIGCITGPMGKANNRLYGYICALQDSGIQFDPSLVYDGNFLTPSGYEGAKDLVAKGVSAIFACNDLMAYGVYQYAEEQQIKIPQQLAVVGYDDLAFSELLPVPLTTVHQPAFNIGKKSSEKLIEMIQNDMTHFESHYFPPQLIVRRST